MLRAIGIPGWPAAFARRVHHDQLAETRQLMSLLIGVHTKLFPDDLKIFEVKSMVESSVEKIRILSRSAAPHLDEI